MTSHASTHIAGIVAGATAMYFLDRDRGARRRGGLRERVVHVSSKLETRLSRAPDDDVTATW